MFLLSRRCSEGRAGRSLERFLVCNGRGHCRHAQLEPLVVLYIEVSDKPDLMHAVADKPSKASPTGVLGLVNGGVASENAELRGKPTSFVPRPGVKACAGGPVTIGVRLGLSL